MNLKLALCICLFLFPLAGHLRAVNPANEANALPDSSIKRLNLSLSKETVDTSRVKILNEIAWQYSPSQSDKAIVFADSALRLAEKIGWQKGQAEAMLNIGDAYRYKGNIKISLENYQNALTVFKQINDKTGIANSLAAIGAAYFHISELPKSLDHLNRALKIFKEINNKKGTAKTYSYIGIIYSTFKEFKKSIEYFNNAIKILEELNDSVSIGVQAGNLGLAYTELKDYTKALSYYKRALNIYKKNNNLYDYSIFLGNMGLVYSELGDYSKAENHFEQSLKFAKELKDEYGIAYQYGNLGALKLKIAAGKKRTNTPPGNDNELTESIIYLTKAVDIFNTLGLKNEQKNFLFSLSDAYKLMGDYRNALNIYSSARALQDSIFSADNKKMIAELEIQKNLELKEKEIKLLNKEKDYRSIYSKAAFILAALLIIISLVIFYFYTKKRKANLLLRENIRIREEAEEALRQNKIELEKHQLHLESLVVERTKNLEIEISERTKTEKAHKESEENNRMILDLAVDAFFQGDMEGNFVRVNSSAAKLTGYSSEELLRLNIKELFQPKMLDEKPLRYDLLKKGETIRSERILLKKDGTSVFVEMSSKRMPGDTFQSFFRDVTERKKAEETLLKFSVSWQILTKATQQLHSVLELPVVLQRLVLSAIELTGAEDGAAGLLIDEKIVFKEYYQNGKIIPIDFSFEKGYGVPGWIMANGKSYLTNDAEHDEHVIQKIRKTLEFYNLLDIPIVNRHGEIIGCFELHNKPSGFDEYDLMLLKNLATSTAIAIENSQMILQSKLAKEKLKISEQTYRGIINSIDEAIYIQDREWTFLDVNDGAVNMYGYPREEIVGKNPLFVSAEGKNDLKMVGEKLTLAFEGYPQEFEFWGKKKNGDIFPKIVRVYKGIYFEKEVVVAVAQDITEKKQAEQKLKDSEELFRNLVENITDVFYLTDGRGKMKYCSPNFFLFTGFLPAEILGHSYVRVVAPVDQRRVVKHYTEDVTSGVLDTHIELRVKRKNGLIFWAEQNTRIVRDEKGNVLEYRTVARDISVRKKAEEALKKSEYQYRNLFETANDAIIIFEPESEIILEANPKACEIYGFAKNELIGLSLKTFTENIEAGEKQIEQTLRDKSFKDFETKQFSRDGRVINFLVNGSAIEYESKPAILSINHDITDRKIAEEKLFTSEQQFRAVWENSADGMRLTNSDGIILMVNKAFCNLVEKNKAEIEGKTIDVVYKIENGEHKVDKHRERFLFKTVKTYFEKELILWNKRKIWFEVTNSFIEIENQPTMLLSIFRDVTQRKLAEFELRKLSEAVEQSPASIFITDINGSIQYVNKSFTEITGYHLDEVFGKNPSILSSGNTTKEEYKILWDTILSGAEWRGEFLNKKKNGELFWEDAIIKPIKDKEGAILNFLAVKEDITLKKRAEQKIQLLAHSLASIGECVSITDKDNTLLFVNDAFTKTYGYTRDELLGQNISIVRPGGGLHDDIQQILLNTLEGGWKGEVINRRKDGTIFPVQLSTSVVKDNDGNLIALIGVASDITEMKKSREDLVLAKENAEMANKLKSEFLAQMSHEIRSPMNVTLSFASLIKEELADVLTPELVDCFKAIDNSGRRLIRTVDLILNMSEAQMGTYEPTWSNVDLLTDVIKNIRLEYVNLAERKGLEFSYRTELKKAVVWGDHNSLNQIFVNLVDNAIKYTKDGKVEIIVDRDSSGNLQVTVADTGIGISEEFKQNIFEPFMQEERGYSRRFEGNGLGLALVKKYCLMNNAEIKLESVKGKGSSFIVTFNSEVKS